MTKQQARELLSVITAFADGKTVQFRVKLTDVWRDGGDSLAFDVLDCEYRVKPEPRRVWVNFYDDNYGSTWLSKEMAETAAGGSARTVEFVEVL